MRMTTQTASKKRSQNHNNSNNYRKCLQTIFLFFEEIIKSRATRLILLVLPRDFSKRTPRLSFAEPRTIEMVFQKGHYFNFPLEIDIEILFIINTLKDILGSIRVSLIPQRFPDSLRITSTVSITWTFMTTQVIPY